MTAYQRMFALAVASGFVVGMLIVLPESQHVMKQAQLDQRSMHSPQAFMSDPLTQPYIQTRVAGVIYSVDHERHQIVVDALSPYPDVRYTRMALTYGTSTEVIAMSPEFIRSPEIGITTLREGTGILVVVPRREGSLRADYITVQP